MEDGKILIDSSEEREFKPLRPIAKRILRGFIKLTTRLVCYMLRGTLPNLDEQPALAVVGTEMLLLRETNYL